MMRELFRLIERADHRISKQATEPTHPFVEYGLASASNAANHSLLWIAIAGLLTAGDRRARRATQRGLLSVGVASAATNAIFKPLLPRPRPPVAEHPVRYIVRRPTSSSFPSGHAASAAAFATAVAMEAPPIIAAPVALAAAGVGYSRISTGVHYPSDVVVGAAIGAGVALGSARMWPRIDSDPATARRSHKRVDVAERSDGTGLTVVVNASAGPSAHDGLVAEIRSSLPGASIELIEDVSDLDDAFERAAAGTAIGVVGGDGTINAAAQVALAHDRPLVVFPGGTLNHFCRDLGVDCIDDAIAAVQDGHLVEVDTATIDGRPFLNTASFGSYAAFVEAREKLEDKIGKWPAVAVALGSVLRTSTPVAVELDGEPTTVWMIFVGNCRYDPPGFAPATRARLDDGELDIRYVEGSHSLARLRLAIAVLTGNLARSKVYTRRVASEMKITADNDQPMLAADGEIFSGSENFTIAKGKRLHVFAPRRD